MRTLIIIAIGLAIGLAAIWLTPAARRTLVVGILTLLWLVVTVINLRMGLSHGYTLAQELPIHALLFGLPTAAFWCFWWYAR